MSRQEYFLAQTLSPLDLDVELLPRSVLAGQVVSKMLPPDPLNCPAESLEVSHSTVLGVQFDRLADRSLAEESLRLSPAGAIPVRRRTVCQWQARTFYQRNVTVECGQQRNSAMQISD